MEYNIGSKIKELRKARKLTLQDVARETGFSPALISQIENNNVSPPIATLSKIARFFDVKIGLFFEEDEVDCKYEVVRKHERRDVSRVISVIDTIRDGIRMNRRATSGFSSLDEKKFEFDINPLKPKKKADKHPQQEKGQYRQLMIC